MVHVELHLVVRDMSARHSASLRFEGKTPNARADRGHLRSLILYCRSLLTLIVALQLRASADRSGVREH